MNIRHFDDPDTGWPHFAKHGVIEQEVAEVLMRPSEDRPGREGSRVAIGRTRSGRYLRVIYVPDRQANDIFVITAYPLVGKPLTAFRRRMRKRTR